MKAQSNDSVEQANTMGLIPRLCIIAAVMIVVGAIAIWVAVHFGFLSLPMALGAWAVCVISSLFAHVLGEYPKHPDLFAARLAGSMAARTGPPFLAVILVKAIPSLTFKSGFVFLIVLFYLVGLLVDVKLQVGRLKSSE